MMCDTPAVLGHEPVPSPPPGLSTWLLAHAPRQRGEPVVRRWLAGIWGLAPDDIVFERGEHGRPFLRAPRTGVDVGWSHSGERLLLAVAPGLRLGVDLECLRSRPRAMDLAQRFYHPRETAWLHTLPPAEREAAFVQLWCAKEAVLKAHGQGISFGLHRLRFEPDPEGRLQLRETDARLGPCDAWQLREWLPVPGYRAALAWRAAD